MTSTDDSVNDKPGGQLQEAAHQRLEAVLALTGYCEDGYFVLKQTTGAANVVIHGECNTLLPP